MAARDPDPLAGGRSPTAAGERVGRLFAEHARMVYGMCRAMLRDPVEAEDATQASFVSAFTSLQRGAVVRDDGAWIATIARHECLHRIRRRTREPVALPDADVALLEAPDDAVGRALAVAELREAIATLPENQRAAVVLRDIYGLRYREVGHALGVSRPSVEALLFRARRTLRMRLKPAVGAALVVPLAVREGVAQAVPAVAGATGAGAAATAGVGLFAKLGSAPVAAKVAAGVAAVGAGSVAAVEIESVHTRPPPSPTRSSPAETGHGAAAPAPALVAAHSTSPRAGEGGAQTEPSGDDDASGGAAVPHGGRDDGAGAGGEKPGREAWEEPAGDDRTPVPSPPPPARESGTGERVGDLSSGQAPGDDDGGRASPTDGLGDPSSPGESAVVQQPGAQQELLERRSSEDSGSTERGSSAGDEEHAGESDAPGGSTTELSSPEQSESAGGGSSGGSSGEGSHESHDPETDD